jgi:hypothetical protein
LNASHEESYAGNFQEAFGRTALMYKNIAWNEEGE